MARDGGKTFSLSQQIAGKPLLTVEYHAVFHDFGGREKYSANELQNLAFYSV
jgi:hypothetical protein